ncbi:MAG: hypothetical protein IT395_07975 [Candidatus Omnitrophica bacterium]|nr:hypothetical protein [Candidatus Omnitrophota bacterium]
MTEPRKEQIDAYLSLVGQVNRALSSRLWWATDFSSKNRFNSRLPERLQELLVTKDPSVRSSFWQIQRESLRRFGAGCYHLCRLVSRSFFAMSILSTKLETVFADPKPAYVIKTFVYDHSFANDGTYKDSFFGKLPEFLKEKGERVIFFANILGDYKSCLKMIEDCPNAVIIPVDYFSSFSSILKAVLASWFYKPQVKGPVKFLNYEVARLVNVELATCSSYIQPYQYLHYGQTKALLGEINAKTFLMTYENNPWEKMCMMAVRESSPQTEIIGYQHTVTPQASVNMFISKEEEGVIPKPDRVLTVGEIPKEIIARYTQVNSLPLEAACALRYESLFQLAPLPRTKTKTILLGLEGIFDVYKMVNFAIEQLKGKDYKVIIRTHPGLPVSEFSSNLVEGLENLPFIEVSQGKTLVEDLTRCDMTMYWGSTVSLESLWVGKPVIHFDLETLFSYDPLFDCSYLKKTVTLSGDLVQVMEQIYSLSDQDFLSERQKADEYLKKYFFPVNSQYLSKFLTQKAA